MSQKLKASVAVMFSVGPIGFFLMMEFVSNYYAYFLTDILKISAATVGTILILVRIIDAVSVPAAGIVVETVKRCWGRYSIWLWLAPPLTTLFVVFMFTRPNFSPVILIMFLGTMYVLTHLTVNLAEASQIALIPVLGKTDEDRVLLSCRRAQGMSAGQVIFGLIAMPMVIALGQGDEGRGFFFTVLIFGLLQMFGYWLAARVAQPFESDAPQNINRVGLNEMVSQIVENKQLLILLAAEICRWSANIVILNYAVYYFKYAAGNMLMVTPFFTSISIATLAGNFLGQLTANKLEKKKTYYLGMSFNFCMMLLAWFFAANHTLFIIFTSLAAVGHAVVMNLSAAYFADAAEYGQWKTKKNVRGVIMALNTFPIKVGVALAGAIAGYSLALIGYIPDAVPTAELITGIRSFSTLIPAAFALLAIFAIKFYALTDRQVDMIRELNEASSQKL